MFVTEKPFQIPVCPSTSVRMHQPLNCSIKSDDRENTWGRQYRNGVGGGISRYSLCWFMYKLVISIYTHSALNLRSLAVSHHERKCDISFYSRFWTILNLPLKFLNRNVSRPLLFFDKGSGDPDYIWFCDILWSLRVCWNKVLRKTFKPKRKWRNEEFHNVYVS